LSRGPLAWSLLPLAGLYGGVVAIRRWLYRTGWLHRESLPVPVVIVGNLIAGGAGKTPTVIAIVAALRSAGYSPGVISRGYGGNAEGPIDVTRNVSAGQSGDEPLLIHLRTQVPVVIGRRRVEAARQLLAGHARVDVIVSDDGLQHLALARDVQVLVFDERGGGNRWLLPAGPLREALPCTLPARTLVVYNAEAASTPLPGTLARRALSGAVSLHDWWQGKPADMSTLDGLRGRPLVAAAGLARPGRFFEMLRRHGLSIIPLELPDHHGYASLPWPDDTADVVVTEKDAIKLDPGRLGATRVWVAPLDFRLDATFVSNLIALLPPPGIRHGNTSAQPAGLPHLQGPA
jgi:tetraacyldisaccharide 4'-kinase